MRLSGVNLTTRRGQAQDSSKLAVRDSIGGGSGTMRAPLAHRDLAAAAALAIAKKSVYRAQLHRQLAG
jgi:hypothetical protein